jgi:plasmid stabilization system protein ParE
MTSRVEIGDQVDRDADAVLEWLHSQHATDAAVAWFRGLEEAIDSLAQFPPVARSPRRVASLTSK